MYQCPRCSQPLDAPDLAGQLVACPSCGGQLTMPSAPPPAIAVTAPKKSITNEFGRAVSWGAGLYFGVVLAAVTLFVVLPLVFCAGMAVLGTVGSAIPVAERQQAETPRPRRVEREPARPEPRIAPPTIVFETEPTGEIAAEDPPAMDRTDTGESFSDILAKELEEHEGRVRREREEMMRRDREGFGDVRPDPPPAPKEETTRRTPGVAAPLRSWTVTMPNGDVETFDARFVSISAKDVVSLRTELGNRIVGPVTSISDKDRKWLKEYLR